MIETPEVKRVRMILPAALSEAALARFAAQLPDSLVSPGIRVEVGGCRAGAALMDSPFESTLADAFVLEAGTRAAAEGVDVVCSFSMSDSGLAALRSRLTIPVVGAGQAALSLALQLGSRFSIVTMWQPWRRHALELVQRYGLSGRLASVRSIDVRPDTEALLSGKEDFVFAMLEAQARAAIEDDGADVIVLGSTTMYQSHAHLAAALPCPVVNPGQAAYKACESLLHLGLSHSKLAYPTPGLLQDGLFAGGA